MNVAIAVNADLEYIKVADKKTGRNYVLLESSIGNVYSDKEQKAAAFTVLE
jgi:isoleucyl-tRNA synthetase